MIEHARYESGELLGEGAQGQVVCVIDRERPSAPLVAKVLAAGSPDVDALAGEFALLARLRIPGLVRVHDFARDARGVPFIVEDRVFGDDPALHVAKDVARLARLAAELAETLGALHEAGFVHGDVKPGNIRVGDAGRAMLLDLGAAVLVRAHASRFTPAFAAPEVRAGAPATRSSDLYSLGATLWACAIGAPPPPRRGPLRDAAPWVAPRIADLIERLLAEHPSDRPRACRDVLEALGRSGQAIRWESGARGEHVHERLIEELSALAPGSVVYLTGPSGAGKSHLLRELATRVLLEGRPLRFYRFPEVDADENRHLRDLLGGGEPATNALLVLDDLEAAPPEIAAALEALRCRGSVAPTTHTVIAALRSAPPGARSVAAPLLDDIALERLAADLGIDEAERASLARQAGGSPGWLAAAAGRVPLTRDAALARLEGLSPRARDLLALVATMGGAVPASVFSEADDRALGGCFAAGLARRSGASVVLASPHLAPDLASSLGSYAVSDRATAIALEREAIPAASLAAIAQAPHPPQRRVDLLSATISRARREEARSLEIDALLALAADPKQRSADRLLRLERLTRDAGTSRAHPQVLAWLEELAEADATAASIALRRRAEERARAGDREAATRVAERALAAARDHAEEAYALATAGAVALWAADWSGADESFTRARALVDRWEGALDREEIARLDHNLGVVALYRGRAEEAARAFERSIAIKRALGDRAGVRACLLNLGLAFTRCRLWDPASDALKEAIALAEALGQEAGRGWCLAARADLEVRRGRAREAERFVAEAEAIGDAIPASVRADLSLLRAQIALLEGDGDAATRAVLALDPALREGDALVDARAFVVVARAKLASLPVDRVAAGRAAISALRRARGAGLGDVVVEAEGALRASRRSVVRRKREPIMIAKEVEAASLWELIATLGTESLDACAVGFARLVVAEAGGERAFLAVVDEAGALLHTWGADLDGLPIAEAGRRVDLEAILAAKRRQAPVYLPRAPLKTGEGSRLAAFADRTAIVVEHRFVADAFDRVSATSIERWLSLARLILRLGDLAAPGRAPAVTSSEASSTAVPRREPSREYPEILGRSPALRRALAELDAAVDTDLPVLVRGETGTGKELFARALHEYGARKGGPFVAVNCAAIAESLFEAELFGHARGAFTGAERARPGLLARAEGGTLFLDEIGELPLPRQAAVLRVLEARRYRPVGSDDERPFDVRIVSATNRDLDEAVAEGSFRKDLLYRLRVLDIGVPPLRDREGDVPLLLRHFLGRAGSHARVTAPALELLSAYAYPGNVRELLHQAQRLSAAKVDRIDVAHLPRNVRANAPDREKRPPRDERVEVEEVLVRTAGNISRAAALLGLTRHGLKKRMLRLGLRAKEKVG